MTAYKFFALTIIFMSILIIINAVVLVKDLGGALGSGLVKVASGTIMHIILMLTFVLLEKGFQGMLSPSQVKLFYMFFGTLGTSLLVAGYYHIYQITRIA